MSDWSEETPLTRRWRTPARIGALVLPLVSCAILSTLRDTITAATAVLVLVLWVVAAAASGDRIAGLLAAVSGGVWFDFFLTEPYQQFTIADPDDIEATVLLVLIGACVTEIALWGHRQQGRAARRSGYLEGVLGTAKVVSEGDAPASAVIEVVARQISDVLGADGCRFVAGPVHDTRIALLDHEGVLTRGGHIVDVDRLGLPADELIALLVRRGSVVVGHFLVTATTKVAYPSREQCRVAVLLADQVAGALGADFHPPGNGQ
jgi:K+-sensing histidine kinase KdpD